MLRCALCPVHAVLCCAVFFRLNEMDDMLGAVHSGAAGHAEAKHQQLALALQVRSAAPSGLLWGAGGGQGRTEKGGTGAAGAVGGPQLRPS